MKPHAPPSVLRRAAGFAMLSAIFLIVILAALAVFISVLATHEQAGNIADVAGLRAYQAARAGIEWGLYNFKRNGACSASTSFNAGGTLLPYTITVSCTVSDMTTKNDEAGNPIYVRRITANACNQPSGNVCPNATAGDGYIERQISVVTGQ